MKAQFGQADTFGNVVGICVLDFFFKNSNSIFALSQYDGTWMLGRSETLGDKNNDFRVGV